jgi:hypothetical protein
MDVFRERWRDGRQRLKRILLPGIVRYNHSALALQLGSNDGLYRLEIDQEMLKTMTCALQTILMAHLRPFPYSVAAGIRHPLLTYGDTLKRLFHTTVGLCTGLKTITLDFDMLLQWLCRQNQFGMVPIYTVGQILNSAVNSSNGCHRRYAT